MDKKVYMTLLGSDNYLIGTLALAQSLKNVKSKYPLVVMVTNNVSEKSINVLKQKKLQYIKIDKIQVSNQAIHENEEGGYSNWSNTFSKLAIFGFTQYEKIVFLDSDMLILKNIDNLFEKEHMSAVVAGKSYPGNEDWRDLNSGTMVIVPKKDEDKRLLQVLNDSTFFGKFGDQDIIQLGYPNWKKKPSLELGEEYNLFSKHEPYYVGKNILNHSIKVIHFVGKDKPWNMDKKQRLRYCARVVKNNLKYIKSIRGFYQFNKNFSSYCKICDGISKSMKN
ncbi:hypothetical protein EFP49_04900 [Lactobacillus johnsonii]|uniref:glycosyltransferase n=1 Tax=Lactobacillus johnsonii TaxID=33959 RepID=UPI0021A5B714|nr:glycosyltransferase [Lactobacillus johnsonii]MCT3342149.1 hypothetical protein [Lactobacillus johnsonii]